MGITWNDGEKLEQKHFSYEVQIFVRLFKSTLNRITDCAQRHEKYVRFIDRNNVLRDWSRQMEHMDDIGYIDVCMTSLEINTVIRILKISEEEVLRDNFAWLLAELQKETKRVNSKHLTR